MGIFSRNPLSVLASSPRDERSRVLHELAPSVHKWCARHLGPRHDLDDVVQDALVATADALLHFRNESSLNTYVYRVVQRSCSRYRQKHRHAQKGAPLHAAVDVDSITPEALAMEKESVRRLYAALDELSEILRSAFVLCAIEQMAHEEAARIEGVSVETLRARLKRARAELSERLRKDPYLGSMWKESAHD